VTPPGGQAQNIGVQTAPLPFTVADPESDASLIVVTATSNNQAFVPNSNIFLGGAGANRTIQVVPPAGVSGVVDITITAIDPQGTPGSAQLRVSFTTPTGFPTINPIGTITIKEDESATVPVIVADPDACRKSCGDGGGVGRG
jgi:hypothetical protein